MKIKTKLYLGFGFLSFLIVILAFFATSKLLSLSQASDNILKDNKESIVYIKDMLNYLSKFETDSSSISNFEISLDKQLRNLTEPGENKLTEKVATIFRKMDKHHPKPYELAEIQTYLHGIWDLNLKALEKKSEISNATARESIFIIGILGILCLLSASLISLIIPKNISGPITLLINSLREVEKKNYNLRIQPIKGSEYNELAMAYNSMASKLQEYHSLNLTKLLAEKKITELLIDKVQYPIIIIDKNYKISLVNKEFLLISTIQEEKLIGKDLFEAANENDLLSQLIITNSSHNSQSFIKSEVEQIFLKRNNKIIYFEKEVHFLTYLDNESGGNHPVGYVFILRDITKYLEKDLAKTNFLATVSHELKTPISALRFSLQLLQDARIGQLSTDQKELIKSCEDDTVRLLKIVSELINFSQHETGIIQLNPFEFDIIQLIKTVINNIKPLSEEKFQQIHFHHPKETLPAILDQEKTSWVLSNILNNAIRYSSPHSDIYVYADSIDSVIKISIEDFGIGISEDEIPKIFSRYYRVKGNAESGFGLGLSICKELVEAQGGKIQCTSTPGKGSIFSLFLNSRQQLD